MSCLRFAVPILWIGLMSPVACWAQATAARTGPSPEADADRMVLVPAGDFLMGEEKDGSKLERVFVDAFYIDEHEVTNVHYRKFLDWVEAHGDQAFRHPQQPAGKSHRPRYWSDFRPGILQEIGIARLQPFDAETFQGDQQPVVGIDWFDAHAYARWAGKRLPREEEWEKAARGTDGRLWPWGSHWEFSRCNSGGYEWNGERDGHVYPAPVGSYPGGISPSGCLDMAGNAWEWTASEDVPGPVTGPGDRGQVVKGGGSNSYPSAVTAASRRVRERSFRYFCLGFRCARNAAP